MGDDVGMLSVNRVTTRLASIVLVVVLTDVLEGVYDPAEFKIPYAGSFSS
jgi:hypothetical protein